jgi:mitochondrial fission protein ELM1
MSRKTLIISDGKPGHLNQALALAAIAGLDTAQAVAAFSAPWKKALCYALAKFRIYTESLCPIALPAGDFEQIIAVSSSAYYPALALGKRLGLPVIALMKPSGFCLGDFEHIFCPAYDNPPARGNITPLPITPCARPESFYTDAVADFKTKTDCSGKAVSIILGGDSKLCHMDAEIVRKWLTDIFTLTPEHKHWVTTSRRTPEAVERVVDLFDFDYKLVYSREQYNPIPAFLMLSDYLFVTSDSASMVSECVSCGSSKVELLKMQAKRPSKFDRFTKQLAMNGNLHIFGGSLGKANVKIDLAPIIRRIL